MTSIVHLTSSRYGYDLPSSYPSFNFVQATLEISTVASSSAGVLVADIHGSVHLLNRDFESVASWIAHVGGRVTHMVERKGVLVTLGVRTFYLFAVGVFDLIFL